MQARAEKAERGRDEARASNALMVEALTERTQQRDEARRLLAWCWDCNTLMGLSAPGAGSYRCPKCAKLSTPVPIREVVVFEERIAALESRLAEVAPVVEAAERLEPHIRTTSAYMDGSTACCVEQKGVKILGELRSAVRAARSLRGAGEGNVEARKGEETGRG